MVVFGSGAARSAVRLDGLGNFLGAPMTTDSPGAERSTVPTGSGEVEPTTMELRVAKAIFASLKGDVHNTEWEFMRGPVNVSQEVKDRYVKMSRAAIRAMRLPITEDMAHAAVTLNVCDEIDAAHIWQAMLDAASPVERQRDRGSAGRHDVEAGMTAPKFPNIIYRRSPNDMNKAALGGSPMTHPSPTALTLLQAQEALNELEKHCSYTAPSPIHAGEVEVCGVCDSLDHATSCPFTTLINFLSQPVPTEAQLSTRLPDREKIARIVRDGTAKQFGPFEDNEIDTADYATADAILALLSSGAAIEEQYEALRVDRDTWQQAADYWHNRHSVALRTKSADNVVALRSALRRMADAYVRRVKTGLTAEEIAKEPWRCAEYIEAEMKLYITEEWLKRHIESDPDLPCEAGATTAEQRPTQDEILRSFAQRLNWRMNEHLCGMKPDYDDSITGFNEAWKLTADLIDHILGVKGAATPAPTAGEVTEEEIVQALVNAKRSENLTATLFEIYASNIMSLLREKGVVKA